MKLVSQPRAFAPAVPHSGMKPSTKKIPQIGRASSLFCREALEIQNDDEKHKWKEYRKWRKWWVDLDVGGRSRATPAGGAGEPKAAWAENLHHYEVHSTSVHTEYSPKSCLNLPHVSGCRNAPIHSIRYRSWTVHSVFEGILLRGHHIHPQACRPAEI